MTTAFILATFRANHTGKERRGKGGALTLPLIDMRSSTSRDEEFLGSYTRGGTAAGSDRHPLKLEAVII